MFTFPAIINLRPALVWKNSLWARKEFFVRDNYNVHDFFLGGGVILRIINFFMFIKRKNNRSGTVSIVVAEKISGYHKEFTIHIFN